MNEGPRLTELRDRMAEHDLAAILIAQPDNRRYLTGFTGSNGLVLVTRADAHLITDSRYYEQAERQAPDFRLSKAGYQLFESARDILAAAAATRVGFESHHLTVANYERMQALAPDIEWVALNDIVDGIRARKDEDEIEIIRRAAGITDRAMAHAVAIAEPGMTEDELAWEIQVFMRAAGAEGLAFGTIVAAGANGALPHHTPGPTPLAPGDAVVIDMGARVDGYCADLTRTFALGTAADPDYPSLWNLVNDANARALEQIRPGMTGQAADATARAVIEAAGYGEQFGHGLGHGVGLNVHESPRLSHTADDVILEEGMVVTIEPGIYLPGRFGIRIEDLAVVRADGLEVLSHAPKSANHSET